MSRQSHSNTSASLLVAALSALTFALALASFDTRAADVYRWKDEQGKYHFSDKRAATKEAETISVKAPVQQPNPELEEYRQSVKTNLAALDAERKQAAQREATQKIIAAGVQQNCHQLRNAMRTE